MNDLNYYLSNFLYQIIIKNNNNNFPFEFYSMRKGVITTNNEAFFSMSVEWYHISPPFIYAHNFIYRYSKYCYQNGKNKIKKYI